MKFAVQKWVRTREMKVIHIHSEGHIHPEYMQNYCAGCHAALAGKPFAAVWAETPNGRGGGYKLCASCTEEAKAELSHQNAT